MLERLKNLSATGEFLIVTTVAFGYFTLGSLTWLVYYFEPGADWLTETPGLTDADLYRVVAVELILLAPTAWFLRLRGWRLAQFGLEISWPLTGLGLALTLAVLFFDSLLYNIAAELFSVFDELAIDGSEDTSSLSLIAIVTLSIVNPIYEEVLVVGYVLNALKHKGLWFALNISVLIRFGYHLYQGPYAVISILPLGLMFGYLYARTGRLWPLILAHGLLDFLALYTFGVA